MDKLFTSIQDNFLKTNKNSKQQSLLQQQQISQQKINDLLEKSAEAISCGPTCQKLKVSAELKQKYLDAETNMQTAPINLEQSKKNYYIYTEGRPYYDNMKEEELQAKAQKIGELLTENFNNEVSSALTMNTYLNTALTNSQYTEDLLNMYLDKNQELKLNLRNSHGDILTNDRKTYYETEALNTLNLWYRLFWYIYYLLVLMLIIAFVLSPSELTIIKKVIIGVLFIFDPYYIDYIVKFIVGLWTSIVSRLPKNVYNNL
jgi:hypothetical protein